MAHPGRWETGVCIGVTLLTGHQKILLGHRAHAIVGGPDVVNTVTGGAHRSVGVLIRCDLLEERDRPPVEVRHVGVVHVRLKPVFAHQLLVGMAIGANLR